MGRLQTWGAAARRSRVSRWSAAVVVVALVAGGVVLATRSSPPPPAAPASGVDPGRRPRGLGPLRARAGQPLPHAPDRAPRRRRLAGPLDRRPTRAWWPRDLGLTMSVRADQLPPDRRPARHQRGGGRRQPTTPAGTASARSRRSRPGTCPTSWRRPTWPGTRPAWSCCRTGPTTSTSAPASSTSWPASSGSASGSGPPASPTGRSRRRWRRSWPTSATSLARAIETVAPHAATIAVLDYYQPIPEPSQIAEGTATSGLHTNLVCSGLKPNAASTYAAAQVVLAALNEAVAGAVADARAHHVTNVTLVDVSHAFDGHGICTARPLGLLGRAGARHDAGRRRGAHPGRQGLHRDRRAPRATMSAPA